MVTIMNVLFSTYLIAFLALINLGQCDRITQMKTTKNSNQYYKLFKNLESFFLYLKFDDDWMFWNGFFTFLGFVNRIQGILPKLNPHLADILSNEIKKCN
jgi:hypothetical protein